VANDQCVKFRELVTGMLRKDLEWNKVQLERALHESVDKVLLSTYNHPKQEERNSSVQLRLKTE